MRTLREVSECRDCPLETEDSEMCGHPDMPQNFATGLQTTRGGPPPDECPLRLGELVIALRVKA
jgi:hypothetical protein